MNHFNFKILRNIRRIHRLKLDDIAIVTGISVGYLNRLERGFIPDIKNKDKRNSLIKYIQSLKGKSNGK